MILCSAGDLGISKDETMIALWFLHHYAGVLMYFPNLSVIKASLGWPAQRRLCTLMNIIR